MLTTHAHACKTFSFVQNIPTRSVSDPNDLQDADPDPDLQLEFRIWIRKGSGHFFFFLDLNLMTMLNDIENCAICKSVNNQKLKNW